MSCSFSPSLIVGIYEVQSGRVCFITRTAAFDW